MCLLINMFNNEKGQIILLSIMILGGVMIGSATIGSYLLRLQINQVNEATESTNALFAADAGLEAVSWCFFHEDECSATQRGPDTFCPEDNSPTINFDDPSVSVQTRCRWDKDNGEVEVRAQGFKASTTRILETTYQSS